jgi:hypothetical protein
MTCSLSVTFDWSGRQPRLFSQVENGWAWKEGGICSYALLSLTALGRCVDTSGRETCRWNWPSLKNSRSSLVRHSSWTPLLTSQNHVQQIWASPDERSQWYCHIHNWAGFQEEDRMVAFSARNNLSAGHKFLADTLITIDPLSNSASIIAITTLAG